RMAMVAECIKRCGRNRVHSIRPNEVFYVHYVAVARILRARACPQNTLGLCALRGKLLPSVAAEDFQIALISQLAVRDGYLALQTLQLFLLLGVFRSLQPRTN